MFSKAKAKQKAHTTQTILTQPVSGKRNQFNSDMCKAPVAANTLECNRISKLLFLLENY
jgi:hypothetical protein